MKKILFLVLLLLITVQVFSYVNINGGFEYLNGGSDFIISDSNGEENITLPFDTVLADIDLEIGLTEKFNFNLNIKRNLGIYNGDYVSKKVVTYTQDGPVTLYNEKSDYSLNKVAMYDYRLSRSFGEYYAVEAGYITQNIDLEEKEKFNIKYDSSYKGPYIGFRYSNKKSKFIDRNTLYDIRAGYFPKMIVEDNYHVATNNSAGNAEGKGAYGELKVYKNIKDINFYAKVKALSFQGEGNRSDYIDYSGIVQDIIKQSYHTSQYYISIGAQYEF